MRGLVRAVLMGTAVSVLIAAPAWADGGDGHHHRHHQRSGTEQTTQEPSDDPSGVDPAVVHADEVDPTPTSDGSLDNGATSAPSSVTDPATAGAGAGDEPATTDPVSTPPPSDARTGTVSPSSSDTPSDTSEPTLDAPSSVSSGDQTVTVTGVAIAVSTSGGNSIDGAPNGDASTGSGAVATGPATAVGSQDQTNINQQVTTSLSGGATADVRQVTIVFNVGVAGANSGANGGGTTGTGGAGSISTGNATAVGNDSDTYLTQAGAVTAPDGTSDSSNQVTVTVRMGVAVADSGGNAVAGGAGSGSVSTGAATATGNNSLTDVSQTATLTGSGLSQLTVEQQAMILNLGVAFANSGMNDVNGLANALLDSPSQDIAEQLFGTLLPALLASTASGGGANVSTGNATAVGNQSQTYVDQTATATAAGDGTATISQNLVVANFGAAVANTGLNGSGPTVALDPKVVGDLAAFFNTLLTTLDEWTADGGSQHLSLVVPFGDLLIALNGDLVGVATAIGSGMEGASSASITQLTAVISLGVSYANTGLNTTGAPAPLTAGGTSGPSIVTGDATAINTSLVIVCQLDDDLTHVCLAPVVASEPPAVDSASGAVRDPAVASSPALVAGRELPATGAGPDIALIAVLLVLGGGALVLVAGRRPRREPAA